MSKVKAEFVTGDEEKMQCIATFVIEWLTQVLEPTEALDKIEDTIQGKTLMVVNKNWGRKMVVNKNWRKKKHK